MRPNTLMVRIFAAMAAISLTSVFVVGYWARSAFRQAFGFYLERQPMMGGPRTGGLGAMMLGATEQEFQASVERAILIAAAVVLVASLVAAYLLARALTRPIGHLTDAAQALAAGDLEHRVEITGPAEVERLSKAFNEMAESLEVGETLRRRMVADVAHELRNPVTALRAQAEGISEGILEADDARIDSIVEDTVHLSRLVTDLQELFVAEAGRLAYEKVLLDVSDLVDREVERAAVLAPPGVVVRSVCPGTDTKAFLDEGRISQVLRNVLSNALRHTAQGEVVVSCSSDADAIVVTVSDTGEGIPARDLPYVFERFYRVDSARSAATGGSGVGLAITKRIVEDHGGSVFAESELGRGTTIGFRLPRSTPSARS